ncbi:hypothetical protein GW7_16341 [Heterocephalus glaber]|uniref:SPATA31-like domain-containing protein n=1 Tax=Heterocephalus glaber TaxID=10181 RepID=G5BQF8_HETGA|nr:hypothetical protein GW7_16341 [Heterocephalus glaber]
MECGLCQSERGSWTGSAQYVKGDRAQTLRCVVCPLGQHYTIHFRQLLCPDLLCEVCNTAAKKVRRLSPATPEDAAISLDSTVRRWSPPL